MQIFAVLSACGISVTAGWIAAGLSFLLGRRKAHSGWFHLLRGAGAAAGCFAGLCAAVATSIVVAECLPNPGQVGTMAISIGLPACPVLGGAAGAFLAPPFLRWAYLFTRWLAHEAGIADGR
jgi:hypothetical protein